MVADEPTMTAANDIETLLRENDYDATVVKADADTARAADGERIPMALRLTIEVQL